MAKLLIVDDDKESIDCVTKFFQVSGYDAQCVYTGDDAMKVINENKPDCILLDIQLPGSRNGIDVLAETKALDKNIKIVMITAFVDAEIEEECNKYGVDGFVIKPLDFQNLLDTVKKLTNKA